MNFESAPDTTPGIRKTQVGGHLYFVLISSSSAPVNPPMVCLSHDVRASDNIKLTLMKLDFQSIADAGIRRKTPNKVLSSFQAQSRYFARDFTPRATL